MPSNAFNGTHTDASWELELTIAPSVGTSNCADDNDKIDDEYLEVIKVDKEVDVLDITDESDPQWSTVTIKRGLD